MPQTQRATEANSIASKSACLLTVENVSVRFGADTPFLLAPGEERTLPLVISEASGSWTKTVDLVDSAGFGVSVSLSGE